MIRSLRHNETLVLIFFHLGGESCCTIQQLILCYADFRVSSSLFAQDI